MESNTDSKKFQGVDLHVHTPASFCYKGPKTDEEYIEILRRYSTKNINVIAITDHNTIKGFRYLNKIKSDLISKLNYLGELYKKYPEIKTEYDKIQDDLFLFNSILILPGIEYEANPGIHLLLIFSPEIELSKIESFLIETGYTEDFQGKENPNIVPKLDVISVMNEISNLNGIVIAPHADSNKGIYNDLEPNQYRASVFRNNNLIAISYNNPINCQKMKGLLQNREYKRKSPIAFIQCSDYHGIGEVGECITYLKIDDLSFESIIQALRNPTECVSPTEHPKIINILNQIVGDGKSVSYKDIQNDEDKNSLIKSACALLNDGYGSIIIGAVEKPEINLIGIGSDNENFVDDVFTWLKSIKPSFHIEISKYPFGKRKYIMIIQLRSESKGIYYLDSDEVFFVKNKSIYKAKCVDIAEIAENRLISRMIEHQEMMKPKFDNLMKEIDLLKENTQQFILINKVEKNSLLLSDVVSIDFIDPYENEFKYSLNNGTKDGDVFFTDYQLPRLGDAYLRISCPRISEYDLNDLNVKKYCNNAIIIAPGGATYFAHNKEWGMVSLFKYAPTLVLSIKDYMKGNLSELSIIGWLKSSIHLWYTFIALGNPDIHNPDIYRKVIIPCMEIMKPGNVIESLVKEILSLEEMFLSINVESISNEDYLQAAHEHNRNVDAIAIKLDKIFYKELGVNSSEEEIIKKWLDFNDTYNLNEITYCEQNHKVISEVASTQESLQDCFNETAAALRSS